MKSETPIRWWQMLIGFAVMIVLILLWGIGFDWLARELQGGLIESVLNWLSNAAFWCVILAVILAFIIRGVVSERVSAPRNTIKETQSDRVSGGFSRLPLSSPRLAGQLAG